MYKLSCITPCYKRPKRTIRALESVINQNFTGFEAFFIGDGCEDFQKLIDNEELISNYQKKADPNMLVFFNLKQHFGGWGYKARKTATDFTDSEYCLFLDNDDIILPNHFKNNYEWMKRHPEVDMGYNNTFIEPDNSIRDAKLAFCQMGHSEIIVKTNVLKECFIEDSKAGHDWLLIENIIKKGYKTAKMNNSPTYIVKSLNTKREEIDD